ncbi:hypothetical protein B0H14DRAFT_2615966 [Mycena olivaceomarginata]|nr:hypothetical protein B0H14DRAFT_2615966 [Mycena olivaceomarginata]
MLRRTAATDIRLDSTIAPTLTLLEDLDDAFGPQFIQPISNTIQTLINAVLNVKRNKNECVRLLENIHQVLYAVINLHIKSETVRSLSPAPMSHIRKFMEIWLRGGLPGKENAKRIQGFTNQWGIYNKYPSFIDNEDITCTWNMKYVETQQNGSRIKNLFHNNEMQNLLKDCLTGLDQAEEVFYISIPFKKSTQVPLDYFQDHNV